MTYIISIAIVNCYNINTILQEFCKKKSVCHNHGLELINYNPLVETKNADYEQTEICMPQEYETELT